MRRYQAILLALVLFLCAYWLGYTNGRDHAYLQIVETQLIKPRQCPPCGTDDEYEYMLENCEQFLQDSAVAREDGGWAWEGVRPY